MNAEQCWNVIVDTHNDYHQNLKHHKYTYNQFVPNDKRMHEFMEIEKPTPAQIKHYHDIFVNEIYNEKDLNKCDETILNSVIPKMQMAIDGKIKMVDVIKTEEKGTDVNLAVQMVTDAKDDLFDYAILFSNDSDMAYAIQITTQQ